MPNWCVNKVRIEGSVANVQSFKEKHFNSEDEFEFNTIVAMPKELEHTSTPENEKILYAFYGISTDRLTASFYSKSDLDEIKQDPAVMSKAPFVKQLYDKYGYVSWYQWSIANWGTKWNSSDTYLEDIRHFSDGTAMLTFEFSTAWSHPHAIYEKLAIMYPELTVTAQFDEESGEYHGSFRSKNTEVETYIEDGYRKDGPFSSSDDDVEED